MLSVRGRLVRPWSLYRDPGVIDMVRFTKMEGLGNDYIYINNLEEQLAEVVFPALSRAVSDRHFGIGSDGLIVILPPRDREHDFRFRMFNADGSEGEMCGNGIRCFARYVYDRSLTTKTEIRVDTPAGTVVPRLVFGADGAFAGVRVDMGPPRLNRAALPMAGPAGERAVGQTLTAGGQEFTFTAVSMGNPHCVIFVADPALVDLAAVGPLIERHAMFPRRVNVHFARVETEGVLSMRTWERGSGITLACGTGACAVLVAAHLEGRHGRQAAVRLPGGELQVEWAADDHIYMTGPAEAVCHGVFTKPY